MARLAGQKLRASYLSPFGTFSTDQKLLASDIDGVAGRPVKASQIP